MKKLTRRMARIMRWPVRIAYWAAMGFLGISVIAGMRNVLPAFRGDEVTRVLASCSPFLADVSTVEMASAGITPKEIEEAITSPTDALLADNVRRFSVDEIPAIREEAGKGRRPFLLFFYSSLREPLFDETGRRRLFRSSPGAVAALGLRQAMERFGKEMPCEVCACRLSWFEPMRPETPESVSDMLGRPEIKSRVKIGRNFFVFVDAQGRAGDFFWPKTNNLSLVAQNVMDFQDWVSGHVNTPADKVKDRCPR